MRRKGTTIRGRAARQKGSRAEIKVRNMLRTIYPTELHNQVQRVPLSGAGAIKCDVMDNNDPDSAYEVKCQETLSLNDWWKQSKRQAGMRTPILVVTQAYRPFYFMMRYKDWSDALEGPYRASHGLTEAFPEVVFNSNIKIMDKLAELEPRTIARITLDDDEIAIISSSFYIEVKTCLFEDKYVK